MDQTTVNLVAMPLFHVGGTCWALASMYGGGQTIVVRDLVPGPVLDLMAQRRVTHAFFVPAVLGPLLTDPGHAGPAGSRVDHRGVIAASEVATGRRHHLNYRDFMAHGGLPPLLDTRRLSVDQRRIVSGGAIGLYLIHPEDLFHKGGGRKTSKPRPYSSPAPG